MSAQAGAAGPRRRELGTMVGIVWRTHRRGILVWVVALAASMIGTAAAVAGLYDTPAKIHTYAAGGHLRQRAGRDQRPRRGYRQPGWGDPGRVRVPGLVPAPAAGHRPDRRARRDGRRSRAGSRRSSAAGSPGTSRFWRPSPWRPRRYSSRRSCSPPGWRSSGVPVSGAILYGAALGALAFAFAGFAALLAQLVLHARGVYTWSLIALAAAYVLRGVGDTTNELVDLAVSAGVGGEDGTVRATSGGGCSLVPVVAGLASGGAAVWLAARRDVGSALLRGGAGPARASLARGDGRSASRPGSTVRRPRAGWRAGSCSPR